MMSRLQLHFRSFIIILVSMATLVTLVVSGTAIYWYESSAIADKTVAEMDQTVRGLVAQTEQTLASVEQTLITLTHASILLDGSRASSLLIMTMASQPLVRNMYFLGGDGKTVAVWQAGDSRWPHDPRDPEFLGIDFSLTPLYRSLQERTDPVWSDKFVSTLRSDTSIGVGIRIGNHTTIAELDLPTLLKAVGAPANPDTRLWVLDRMGEVLVDTGQRNAAGVLNIRYDPAAERALAGQALPRVSELQGIDYHAGAARSVKLGWVFIAGMPAGPDNPRLKNTLMGILLLAGSFLVTTLALSPLWSKIIAAQANSLRRMADRIAEGDETVPLRQGIIEEFNGLSHCLHVMADRIRERESALRDLNQELEQRVADRTRDLEQTNCDLKTSLERNTKMQDLLVQNEKVAALGRMVAGIAHEMNTPIGNAVMAISTLKEDRGLLVKGLAAGLRKSDLDTFLAHSDQGLEIAERNVNRAAELIGSFKHVASDQTSSVRRTFELAEMMREVLLTLHPMLKRSPHKLEAAIAEDLRLDSYPGAIGQIVTNLISNALVHAWEDGQAGHIVVSAQPAAEPGWIRISVSDDGKGIPESLRKKIFEPFFTTRMGRGGTGLGLNIAYNGARNVLGGNLDFESREGGGTVFHLDIPLVAPVLKAPA